MKIYHAILGEVEVKDIKQLASESRTPYPHTMVVTLCNKIEDQEAELKSLREYADSVVENLKKVKEILQS